MGAFGDSEDRDEAKTSIGGTTIRDTMSATSIMVTKVVTMTMTVTTAKAVDPALPRLPRIEWKGTPS